MLPYLINYFIARTTYDAAYRSQRFAELRSLTAKNLPAVETTVNESLARASKGLSAVEGIGSWSLR